MIYHFQKTNPGKRPPFNKHFLLSKHLELCAALWCIHIYSSFTRQQSPYLYRLGDQERYFRIDRNNPAISTLEGGANADNISAL